jgi:hypothetical protein
VPGKANALCPLWPSFKIGPAKSKAEDSTENSPSDLNELNGYIGREYGWINEDILSPNRIVEYIELKKYKVRFSFITFFYSSSI